jgi:hypothetical protein
MKNRQFGDYQTPPELVEQILAILQARGICWSRVLEPTCGKGNFIAGLLSCDNRPKEIIGIELQNDYWEQAVSQFQSNGCRVEVLHKDIFDISLKTDLLWNSSGSLLILGNPPWVTNSEIGSLQGNNLPCKKNFKGCRGIEAITGRSNFDLAEYILIKLIVELQQEKPTLAFLCKTSVARNVFQYACESGISISGAEIRRIDAKKWFSAAVDACLFVFSVNQKAAECTLSTYSTLDADIPERCIGYIHHKLVSDVDRYDAVAFLEGQSSLEWRQGIKHDAAAVMELTVTATGWKNGLDESVRVEDDYIYPLLKSSNIQSYSSAREIKGAVIVPQKKAYAKTHFLHEDAPRLWAYLNEHIQYFNARKSSIYKNKPSFSVFGLGEYSFSPYKIMVSGLYKTPRFIAVGPFHGKPVFCDDTCYLLACESATQAAVIETLLNHPLAKQFLESIAFFDSKRPVTKTILKRLAYDKLLDRVAADEIRESISFSLCQLSADDEQYVWTVDDLRRILCPEQAEQLLF